MGNKASSCILPLDNCNMISILIGSLEDGSDGMNEAKNIFPNPSLQIHLHED